MRTATKWIGLLAAAVLLASVAACGGAQHPSSEGLDQWASNHPEASRELGVWVETHPDAAHKFFEWDAHHTERAREFVVWTIEHPEAHLDVFVATHPGWQYFDQITINHAPATEAFMVWCRRHRDAALALMNHPGGLQWAGNHLYAGERHLESH